MATGQSLCCKGLGRGEVRKNVTEPATERSSWFCQLDGILSSRRGPVGARVARVDPVCGPPDGDLPEKFF
jgi:hypothetical protein